MASETADKAATATAPDTAQTASGAAGDNASNAGNTAGDAASSVDDGVVDKPPPKATKKELLVNHCKRFWWVHVIVVLVLLIILLPILFTLIIPAIVQDVVNDQKLPVYNGELRVVSGSQVSLTLDTMLDTPLKTTVGPMKMTLASNDEKDAPEFLSVDFPKEGVLHKTNVTVPAQVTNVLDQDALVDWFGKLFDAKEKEVRVGSPKSQVKLNGLDYHPTLSQVAHIKGLQYLEGFSLKSINFQLPPDKDGYNTRGTLNLPNHGSLSLYLGDAAFNLLAGDATIGIMKIDGLTLKKGMNHPEFYGKLFFDQLLPNIAEVLAGQGNSLKNGELLTHLGGNATLVDGKHVGYLERVLAPKRIPLPIPVTMFVGQLLKSMTAGSGTDTSDLVDVLGGAFGNKTLIDDVMGHWKSFSNAADKTAKKTTKQKRAETPIGSRMAFVKSMLKLGLRTKTKAR